MEFSHLFGFLKIVNESIKLLPRNGKLMASITTLTLLLPSLFFSLLVYYHRFLTIRVNAAIMDSSWNHSPYTRNLIIIFNLALLLLAAIPFWLACYAVSSSSTTAVMYVSAMSYSDEKLTLQDLFSRVKRQWRWKLSGGTIRRLKKPALYALVSAILVGSGLIHIDTNVVVVMIGIVEAKAASILLIHASVVSLLAAVVSAVEESCDGREAVERAEQLVKRHRLHGFIINFFVCLLLGIVLMAYYWSFVDDEWYLNIGIHGAFIISCSSVVNFFICVAYTVLYFQCKKQHGQLSDVLGKK